MTNTLLSVTVALYIATSQDGFIADKNGNLDWLPQTAEQTGGKDYGYSVFYESVDALAIGRSTYEQILTFGQWPYPGKKCYIFSKSPKDTENKDIEFVTDDIPTFLKKLNENNVKKLWLVGGASLTESFYRHGKIDEYIITRFPVELKEGIPLKTLEHALITKTESHDFGDGVVQEVYKDSGLVGRWYDAGKERPSVILLSGSDGGIPGENAIPQAFIDFLVGKGCSVLALGYFGANRLPEYLENIPLEYFEKAINWLKQKASSISLIGQSRGGELALILGTKYSDSLKCIVAVAPSGIVCGGFPHPNRPAWTYQGKPLSPFQGGLKKGENLTEAEDLEGMTLLELFQRRMEEAKDAAIEVEKISCPLLILCGDDDAIWPSSSYAEQIKARKPCQVIIYKQVGHGILSSYDGEIFHPVGKFWCRLGGKIESNKEASQNSWQKIINFLN